MDWKNWFRRRESDEREFDEEIQAHLSIEARERMEAGEPEKEAWRGARRDFGNVPLIKDVTREMWGWTSLERIWRDLRYGFRVLQLHQDSPYASHQPRNGCWRDQSAV
jgi:putative ABC transport system permease protein